MDKRGRLYSPEFKEEGVRLVLSSEGLSSPPATFRRRSERAGQFPLLQHQAHTLAEEIRLGVHRDAEGKLALVACESERYRELLADPSVKKTRAYRSKAP
jgi:transposase-like protein